MRSLNKSDLSRYQSWRETVYRLAAEEYAAQGLSFRGITREDIVFADKWDEGRTGNIATWWWRDYYEEYHKKPSRFDLAIMLNGQLFALCYGIPSGDSLILEIKVIQKDPHISSAIKVLSVVLYAARLYAKPIGAKEIRICEPINEKLVKFYEAYGYAVTRNMRGKALYLTQRINERGAL